MGTVRRKQRKRKVNNAGFSLVELLVSMVILAIIVVPLLNSFLTAARTNAKAKRVLEATTAGQNLVERIKAQSVEDFVTGGAASGAASARAHKRTGYNSAARRAPVPEEGTAWSDKIR